MSRTIDTEDILGNALGWPLPRVLGFLRKNGFSDDWVRTFEHLKLHGTKFLDIGLSNGGDLARLEEALYTGLAGECRRSGTDWNLRREQVNSSVCDGSFVQYRTRSTKKE